jgi:hypothetical protein
LINSIPQDVDARHKAGHDEWGYSLFAIRYSLFAIRYSRPTHYSLRAISPPRETQH